MSVFKSSVLALSVLLCLQVYGAELPSVIGALCFLFGGILARQYAQSALTMRGAFVLGLTWLLAFGGLSIAFSERLWHLDILEAKSVLNMVDSMLFVGLGGALGFVLRYGSLRHATGKVAELLFAAAALTTLFVQHRYQSLDRPRFLADWAMIHGLNPYDLILGIGLIAATITLLISLRQRFLRSLFLGVVLLLGVAGLMYFFRDAVEANSPLDNLVSNASKKKSGGAQDRLDNQQPPKPIAVALLHSDFEVQHQVLYFRQQVLSFYDGTRFSTDPIGQFDDDVIKDFPTHSPITRPSSETPGYRTRVDASMFLLANHPQPFALSNSVEVKARTNPAPRRFVAAYDTVSDILSVPYKRLLGRPSIPKDWSSAKREHYLSHSTDPRYMSLADELAEETELSHFGDELLVGLTIKRYLEKNGFYTLKEKHAGSSDPAASFLFGNLKGYCVHFAHAAVHLLRAQGIASRVAVGYAVDLRNRGDGSAIIIMANTAHAWPEVHIAGIGWIPFDIYPEQSDEPPPGLVQQSLESLLGELARDDEISTAYSRDGVRKWTDSVRYVVTRILIIIATLFGLLYIWMFTRQLYFARASATPRQQFRLMLDRLSSLGYRRASHETRRDFSDRMQAHCPSLRHVTQTYQAYVFGDTRDAKPLQRAGETFYAEIKTHFPLYKRLIGSLNPIGWLKTR